MQEYPYPGVPGFSTPKYSISETLSWMFGGMDNLVMLKDQQGASKKVGFGVEKVEHQFDLKDHVGVNVGLVNELFNMSDICWKTIMQRVLPQELNLCHVGSPGDRRCIAWRTMQWIVYMRKSTSSKQYRRGCLTVPSHQESESIHSKGRQERKKDIEEGRWLHGSASRTLLAIEQEEY
eukprot:4312800-Amphidinium_carterae.6